MKFTLSTELPPLLAVSYFGSFENPKPSSRWSYFFDTLRNQGIALWNDRRDSVATHLVAIDFNRNTAKQLTGVSRSNRLQICVEPRVVNPLQYSRRVVNAFSKTIATSSEIGRVPSSLKPLGGRLNSAYRSDEFFTNNGRRVGCVMLNQNKFSLISTSNYALRNRVVKNLYSSGIPISVGGLNWERGYGWTFFQQFTHFLIALRALERPSLSQLGLPIRKSPHLELLGRVSDELEVLSRYRICLVIENESSYVSEKLYRALRAGCQCVYVGPRLDETEFPVGFLHQAPAIVSEIRQSLERAGATPYSIDSSELRDWFQSSEFARRNNSHLQMNWIVERIVEWLGLHDSC